MTGQNIKLKDRSGAAIDYSEVTKIQIPAADGNGDITYQLPPTMQEKDVTITANGDTSVSPDSGYDGLSKVDVTVAVPVPEIQAAETDLSMWRGNQVITAPTGTAYSMVTIRKPATFIESNIKSDVVIGGVKGTYEGLPKQAKFVDLNMRSGNQTITPDTGYVMSSVRVTKPSTMTPDNIRKNVDIGGVVGTLEGAKTEETPTVDLDMSSGNQTILPLVDGNVMTEVTVTKPDTFIPSNIRKNVSIGGVVGTYEASGGEEQAKTVDLDMATGNQVVNPDAGKTLSQVTITKPATMIPGNIKKDVNIGGVVGTLDTGGGSADVSNWGDAEGEGCIIYSPDGISIDVYGKTTQDLGYLDPTNYITWLKSDWGLSQTSLQTELDAWAAKIMTPGTAENTRFTSVFSGATKAIFMWNDKKIECDVPSFQDSDPKTYAGLVGALKRTMPTNEFVRWDQNDANNCITEYGGSYDYNNSTHVTFPFVWSPAESVNAPPIVKYMTLQTPTEPVPDLSLFGEAVVPLAEMFYLNMQMALVFYPLEGSDVQHAALILGNLRPLGMYSYSYGAQTITYQNSPFVFPQGWGKLTSVGAEGYIFSPITEADMQTELNNNGGFDPAAYLSVIAFDTTGAPEEEKQLFEGLKKWVLSFFKLQDGEIYEMNVGANRFEMRFNLAKIQP